MIVLDGPVSDQLAQLAREFWEAIQGVDAVELDDDQVHRLCDLLRDMSRRTRQMELALERIAASMRPEPTAEIIPFEPRILPDTTMPCAVLRGRKATVTLDDPYGGDAA